MADHTTPAGGQPAGTSDEDFDRLADQGSLPTDTVRLCLNGTLRREYEEVKRRIDERAADRDAERTAAAAAGLADVRLSSPPPAAVVDERDPEQDRLDKLVEQMRGQMVTFVLKGMPAQDFNALLEQHPPRRAPTGGFDPRDYQGFNSSTFYPALVRKSIIKPTMTDARWAKLNTALTDAQFDRLAKVAGDLNRREEDVPL